MVECIGTMVLVSAAAVSSIFLATAAFLRGFTDPAPGRRSTRPFKQPVATQHAAASGPLGIRFGVSQNTVDPLEDEAIQNNNPYFGSNTPPLEETALFTSRLENVDVQRLLSNRRLVRNYVGCMLNTKPCTAEIKEFRRAIPDVLLTECAKCTERMKTNIMQLICGLQSNYSHEWDQLTKRYDPDGNYRLRYKQYLEYQQGKTNAFST